MSLEAALQENTAALKQVAALLEQNNAGRAEALAAAQALKADAEPKKRGRPAKDDKAAAPKPENYAGDEGIAKVRAAFGAYLGVDDADERETRKGFVRKILERFGVEKATEIAEADRPQAVEWVNTLAKGENVPELADDSGDDDDDMLG